MRQNNFVNVRSFVLEPLIYLRLKINKQYHTEELIKRSHL